jgi:hypothetical protein
MDELSQLVSRFLELPVALQILLLVLALPGGGILVAGILSVLRRGRRPRR